MTQDTSFGMWFKADTLVNDAALLTFSAPGGTQDDNILYRIGFDGTNNEQLRYTHQYGAGNSESQVFSTNITAGAWNHIFVTRDGSSSEVKLYLNGTQFGSGFTYTNAPDGGGNSWLTVGQNLKSSSYFVGSIDDVRLYNRVLNDAEVSALHEAQHPPSEIRVSDLQKDLVGHWGMDGNAKDSTPHRNHGTVNGATSATDRHGQSGSALDFDGVNDYISGVNQPDVQTSPNLFTVSGYINPGNQDSFFITPWSNGVDQFIAYDAANERLRVNLAESANTNVRSRYSTVGAVPLNTWTQWAVVINDLNVKIYINGELDQEYNESISIAGWENEWIIGQRGVSTFWLLGKLDDIRVYGRELSPSEVKQLYDSYRPVVQMSDLQKGLIGHWDMNGHPKDLTPYRNHGTVTGAALAADRHGRVNSAYEFDGTTAYIALGDLNGLFNDEATLSFWVKLKNAVPSSSGRTGITRFGTDSNSHYPWTNKLAYFHTFRSARVDQIPLSSQIDRTTWHLVTITTQPVSNGWKLYQNTELIHQVNGQSSISLPAEARIGRSPATHYLDGYIDDVRLYNRALSADEIKMLHEAYR